MQRRKIKFKTKSIKVSGRAASPKALRLKTNRAQKRKSQERENGWNINWDELSSREMIRARKSSSEIRMYFDRQSGGEEEEHIQALIDYVKKR